MNFLLILRGRRSGFRIHRPVNAADADLPGKHPGRACFGFHNQAVFRVNVNGGAGSAFKGHAAAKAGAGAADFCMTVL